MYKRSIQRLVCLTMVVLVVLAFAGCRKEEPRKPLPSIPEKDKTHHVKIPDSISIGDNKEPALKVYIEQEKQIKDIKFEDYIAGVVAGEMKNDWPEEALAAQAIIARSYVMNFIETKGGSRYKGAHISTDIEEAQAWNSSAINERVRKAVKNTRGMVIVYGDGFAKTWFHAHSGGRTATAKEGLAYKEPEPPYIQVVDSPDSREAPKNDIEWTAMFTKQELLKAMADTGREIEDFQKISIGQKGPSGRAVTIMVDDIQVSAPELRLALGSTKMKSTLLDKLSVEGDKVKISGRGYGHGVGMSQWGAYSMAKQGKSAQDIIRHYYKNIDIIKLWE